MKLIYKLAPLALAFTLATPVFAADYDNHWAKTAIDKWTGHQIVAGYEDGTFRPSSNVTRAELATFITRTFGLTETEGARQYTDVTADKWYADAVAKVSSQGIMYTPGNEFLPNQKVTREEAAYAIYRAYQIAYTESTELDNFEDYYDISTWAADAVGSLVADGYMKGYEDGTFRPQGNVTRAEIVTMLDNISPYYISEEGTYTTNLEGNVVINSEEVVLSNMTIDGNLYITQGVGSSKVTLDNVKVTGTLYIDGGAVTMSGDFQKVEVASGKPVTFTKGTAKEIFVEKEGTVLTLEKNTVTDHLIILAEVEMKGEGTIKEISDFRGAKLQLAGAGIYVEGNYKPIEVQGNKIVIDLAELNKQYPSGSEINGLQIDSTIQGAVLKSSYGEMQTNTRYDFRMANRVTGILDEMLEEILDMNSSLRELANIMGVTGDSAFDILGVDNSISISEMIDKYNLVEDMVRGYAGVTLPSSYTFERTLSYPGEDSVTIQIQLIVKK